MITTRAPEFRDALPTGGVLIGLDPGTKTIGLALCDAGWRFATPDKTIMRRKFRDDKARIAAVIAARQVVGMVIGLPLNMDGSDSPRAQADVGRTLVHPRRRTRDDRPGHEPRQTGRTDRCACCRADPAGCD